MHKARYLGGANREHTVLTVGHLYKIQYCISDPDVLEVKVKVYPVDKLSDETWVGTIVYPNLDMAYRDWGCPW